MITVRVSLSHLKVMYPVKISTALKDTSKLHTQWKTPNPALHRGNITVCIKGTPPTLHTWDTIQGNKELKWIVPTWDQKIIFVRKKWQMSSDTDTCFVKRVNCVFCSHPLSKSYICFMNWIFFLLLWTLWSVFLFSPTYFAKQNMNQSWMAKHLTPWVWSDLEAGSS